MNHKIAVAQFEIKVGSPSENIAKGLSFVDKAIEQNVRLVILPELWTSGYDLDNCGQYIDTNQKVTADLHSRADQNNIMIGGSYITQDYDGYRNTFLLIQPHENNTAAYQKIHLFKLLDEPQYFTAGSQVTVQNTPLGRVGLAICYDVRFPEMFRVYSQENVDLILVSAEWGIQRQDHWRTLLRARAIENQAFVIAANSVGPLFETASAGFSAVIDPWGNVLAEANGSDECLLTAEIDLEEIKTAGEKISSREDARNDLYSKWLST